MSCQPASSRSATSDCLPTATGARRSPFAGSVSVPPSRTSIHCSPRSRRPRSAGHAHNADAAPSTSSRVIRPLSRPAPTQHFSALPSTLPETTMPPSIPIRLHATVVAYPTCAALCGESAPGRSTQPSSQAIGFATESPTGATMANFGFPRAWSTVSALRKSYPIPIHPPR
jgi:hypothetical protein